MSSPTRRIRSPCCARAASGHATAAPPSSVMNARRFANGRTRLARTMGGDVTVTGEPGKGSVFTVRLPGSPDT
jgi:hypothetical protein